MPAADKITVPEVDAEKDFTRARASRVRKSFEHNLLDDDGKSIVGLTVKDWKSVRLFLAETPDANNNPGGPSFTHILEDTKDAIEQKDSERLFQNLLLIYKAVGRA